MKKYILLFLFFSIARAGIAQNQIFLAKKSNLLTSKPVTLGTTTSRMVTPTVGLDKRFMAITTTETTIKGTKINYRLSSLLFNLETGNVVKQFKNAFLYFMGTHLIQQNYGDIWDESFGPTEFMEKIYGNVAFKFLDPATLQEKNGYELPQGHSFGGVTDHYVLSMKREGAKYTTYLWENTSTGLEQVGKYPFNEGKVSANGALISGVTGDVGNRHIAIYDVNTGDLVKRINTENETPITAQITRNRVLIYSYIAKGALSTKIIDLQTGKELAHFPNAGAVFILDDAEETLLIHSSNSGEFQLVDMSDFSVLAKETYAVVDKVNPFVNSRSRPSKVGNGDYFLIGNPSGIINLVSIKLKRIIADIYVDHEDWAVVARDGRVDGTPGALNKLEWREYNSSGKVVKRTSLNAAFANFFTPGLLPSLLRGEVGDISELRKQLAQAPSIEIVSPAGGTETSEQEISVTVKATANGDPVKDIQLFVNGKLIGGGQRGLKIVKNDNEKSFTVLLVPGKNIISAKAISQNNYESEPDYIEVEYKGGKAAADLHILAIGIDEYINSSYNLNYAVADAAAIVKNIQARSADIFGQILIHTIYNEDATKEQINEIFRQIAEGSKPEDVFVFFYAGHGVMSEGAGKDFYLALHEVTQLYGKEELLKNKGISATELRTLTSGISAQKQMIILDACQSGGAVQTFALRGAAEEKAMIQLARSTGVTLLASTGSEQFATEFKELGHGVFTYAILQGLNGKADGGSMDNKITVKELEAYLNDAIPQLTQQYKGTVQFPRSWSQGMDFPIGVVQE